MFGSQNDQQKQDDNQIPAQAIDDVVNDEAGTQPAATPDTPAWQHPGAPLDVDAADHDTANTVAPTTPSASVTPPSATLSVPGLAAASAGDDSGNDGVANELIDIKQQALTQLSPLVGHLDQTPEEKFRTTMMMIQASDDQTLVKGAYEAAQKIEDEKTRAQALLDIINEINYFTQHHPQA